MLREIGPGETRLAFAAMSGLRPHVTEEAFVAAVDDRQRPEGYRLVGAFEEGDERAAAVAGFRLGHNLSLGRYVYVDDLSTLPAARGRGHGRALLEWVRQEAAELGCQHVHLDSAVGLERAPAHRLYLNAGYVIAAHHFVRPA